MPVELEPLSEALAQALVTGDLSGVSPGEGWPHADTMDGLRIAVSQGHEAGWLVLLDGVVIGDCGTLGPPNEAGEIEVGYGLAVPYRGCGHGSELVRALTQTLLARPGVQRLTAKVLRENTPSRRALERAGFVVEQSDDEHRGR